MKMSRKITILIVLTFTIAFLYSCNSSDPDKVVEQFAQHWYKGELDEVKRYVTPKSIVIVDNLKKQNLKEDIIKKNNTEVKLTFIDIDKPNDSTMIYKCDLFINENHKRATFHLEKIDNQWYVKL